MEGIEAELQEKGIEKSDEIIVQEKPRKPRSQAQKDAFEKARKKRAENLAKKKLEKEKAVSFSPEQDQIHQVVSSQPDTGELEQTAPSVIGDVGQNVPRSTAKGKKRGRPKGSKTKLKRERVPEVGEPNFLPPNQPPPAGDIRYNYQQPPSSYNPWMAYQPPQPPPQVHNYYYGHQQGAVQQGPTAPAPEPEVVPPPEVEPEFFDGSSESEDEENYFPPEPTANLKYRFA